MPSWRAYLITLFPYIAYGLSLDQKVSLKLIESLWQDEQYRQAEEEIDKFLSKYSTTNSDETLSKLKADLYIKKKDFKQALDILENISDRSAFSLERYALCLYELKQFDRFIKLFDDHPDLHQMKFGQKIWDMGLAEAVNYEQNLEKKQKLIEKVSQCYESELKEGFDESKALSLALLQENKHEFQKAYALYSELYSYTKDDSYQLCMARMLSHYNPKQALDILETLRWKSGTLGTNAALYAMQIMDRNEDFHELYSLSLEELKIAPEGFRKAKISLYHLKSLFYLKCFDRIPDFYFTYHPHKMLKSQDLTLAVNLISKAYVIRKESDKLHEFYKSLQKDQYKEAQITAGRILAKDFLDHKDFAKAQPILEDLNKLDVLHTDEYLTTLGLCYLNTQAYEVAETYFLRVVKHAVDQKARQKALAYLLDIPKLSLETLNYLNSLNEQIDLKSNPKAVLWLAEGLRLTSCDDKAIDLLSNHGDPNHFKYHQLMGELLENKSIQASISHFEKALNLVSSNEHKAYLHNKLFACYFDHNKEKAIDHLFSSINLYNVNIPDHLFEGLASYLYQKAFEGIKVYLNDPGAKESLTKLLRLLSYKSTLNQTQKVILSKTLRKLCRFEEALKVLETTTSFEEKLELARLYNHMGQYQSCDQILSNLIKAKPYTLFVEGQVALLTKICMHYDRLIAQTASLEDKEAIEKDLRVLQVCIQDEKSALAFEVSLIRHLFFKDDKDKLSSLQFHPYFQCAESGSRRKILNFLINNTMSRDAALSIEDNLSDTMEWVLIKIFGSQTCLQ